jgi:hypothetical protein
MFILTRLGANVGYTIIYIYIYYIYTIYIQNLRPRGDIIRKVSYPEVKYN